MPLDRLVLILVIVVAAVGATVFLATLLSGLMAAPGLGWLVVLPMALIGYVIFRVVADRLGNREDDHYDRIEK